MNFKKLIRPFKRRLLPEQLGHASMLGACVGISAVFLLSLIFHILCLVPDIRLLIAVGAGLFIIVFLVCMLTFDRPGTRKTAARIDALGLNDRVSTMLEYADDSSEIAALQRKDAIDRLKALRPSLLKPAFSPKLFILLSAFTLAMFLMLSLPYDIFAKAEAPVEPVDPQEQLIKDLLSNLKKQFSEDDEVDPVLDRINMIIETMRADAENPDLSYDEKISLINATRRELRTILSEEITNRVIANALAEYELTAQLAEAIRWENPQLLVLALIDLFDKNDRNTSTIKELADILRASLVTAGSRPEDRMYKALTSFASNLERMYNITGPDLAAADIGQEYNLNTIYNEAWYAILHVFDKYTAWRNAAATLDDILEKVDEEAPRDENESSEDNPEGDEEGEKPEDSEIPDDGEMPGFDNFEDENQEGYEGIPIMTEGIYDPTLGSVTYGDIFSAYYAEYLKKLENGEIPEDSVESVEKYYENLGNTANQQ